MHEGDIRGYSKRRWDSFDITGIRSHICICISAEAWSIRFNITRPLDDMQILFQWIQFYQSILSYCMVHLFV